VDWSPLAPFASQAEALDALLYERRYSLLFEGQRWNDYRRFKRLNQLSTGSANPFCSEGDANSRKPSVTRGW
jgi:hypothetical protein